MGRLQRSFRWANVILVFLTFFAYLSPYVHPATFWPFAVLGLIYPVLLVLNLFFVIFWLFQRKRYAVLSLACIILGWTHFTAFVGLSFGGNSKIADRSATLRVLSYNIYGFKNLNEAEHDQGKRWSETQVVDFYNAHEPDIWCFQEFTTAPKYARRYSGWITQKTPLKHAYFEVEKGLAIFSRYPLKPVKMHYFGANNSINGFLIADVNINGQSIRVFNIHLQSNAVSQLADEVAQNGQLQEKETWLQIKGMIGRYRRTAARRSDQALEIQEYLFNSPNPVVICGDFNDVPLSYAYQRIRKDFVDGFRQKGSGLGTTFHGSLPALRIDYILSSPELSFLDYHVLRSERSDHYPILSTIKVGQ